MSMSPVSAIECHGISGEKPSHHRGNRVGAGSQAEVEMVGQQGPSITCGGGFLQNTPKSFQKTLPVTIVDEYLTALYPSHNYVMKSVWGIDACLSWHEANVA
jgi:hypothetical protein